MIEAVSNPNKDTPIIKPALIKESSTNPASKKETPAKLALTKENSTKPTPTKAAAIKGIVKSDLDMDALFKQAKGLMKKKKKGKKKRTKTTSNKDSYSYYTESVCGITLTNQSQIIKEEMDDEIAQLEIMEVGSPKVNADLLQY